MKTTVKSTVEQILRKSESARNSDKALIAWFLREHGLDLDRDQLEILLTMPSLETARRERQKFQQAGKYLPTKKEAQARATAAHEVLRMNDFYPKSEIEIPNQKQPTEPFTSISTPASITRLPEVGMTDGLVVLFVMAVACIALGIWIGRTTECDKTKMGYKCSHRPGECDRGGE
jgi:hypothetical protein